MHQILCGVECWWFDSGRADTILAPKNSIHSRRVNDAKRWYHRLNFKSNKDFFFISSVHSLLIPLQEVRKPIKYHRANSPIETYRERPTENSPGLDLTWTDQKNQSPSYWRHRDRKIISSPGMVALKKKVFREKQGNCFQIFEVLLHRSHQTYSASEGRPKLIGRS